MARRLLVLGGQVRSDVLQRQQTDRDAKATNPESGTTLSSGAEDARACTTNVRPLPIDIRAITRPGRKRSAAAVAGTGART